jgi:uncharacterized protein involved in exopolysaccharide biosynthesis
MIQTENYKRELIFIFFAQKKVIIWTTLFIFLCSILIAFFWPPTYSSTGTILIRGKKVVNNPESLQQIGLRNLPVSEEDLFSEVEILMSNDTVQMAIDALKEKAILGDEDVMDIKANFQTEVVPTSNVIKTTYNSKEQEKAVKVLDALMENYILYRTKVYRADEANVFFNEMSNKFRSGLENKEDEMQSFIDKNRVANPELEIEYNIRLKKDLELELSILRSEYIDKKMLVNHLESTIHLRDLQYFSFLENEQIKELSLQLMEISVERAAVMKTYLEGSERAKDMDRQVDDIFLKLKGEAVAIKEDQVNRMHIIGQKIKNMEGQISAITRKNVELHKWQIDLNRISRETALLQHSYETLSTKREEARIEIEGNKSNFNTSVSVLSSAFPSDGPVFPVKGIVIPLGLFVGYICGCCLGFLREYFDHTFKKPSDVVTYAGLPVIFSVPEKNIEPS